MDGSCLIDWNLSSNWKGILENIFPVNEEYFDYSTSLYDRKNSYYVFVRSKKVVKLFFRAVSQVELFVEQGSVHIVSMTDQGSVAFVSDCKPGTNIKLSKGNTLKLTLTPRSTLCMLQIGSVPNLTRLSIGDT